MSKISIYFYSGDFATAWENYRAGRPQSYASHNEIMAMAERLVAGGTSVRIVTFVSERERINNAQDGLDFVELGAAGFDSGGLLSDDVDQNPSDFILAHFPNQELLQSAMRSDARVFAVLASSFNSRSVRAQWRNWKFARLLNDDRIEWVANHCEPSTRMLEELGVSPAKLIPWNIRLDANPSERPPRKLREDNQCRLFYAGSISEEKGVSDLIEAVKVLTDRGRVVNLRLAGNGALDEMKRLVARLGLAGSVSFLGSISNTDVIDEMRLSDIIVVPSRHSFPEGLPFTLFEALASRTPVVCSNHPVFVYFVDGITASTFPAGDRIALADAIERPLDDATLYFDLSRAADDTWVMLSRTSHFATMVERWVADVPPSSWLRSQTLASLPSR